MPLQSLLADARFALRSLAKSPAYSVAALAILALGIGANAAIFSVAHAVLVKPLPFPEPDRVVRVWETYSKGRGFGTVAAPNYRDWRAAAKAFDELAAYHQTASNLEGTGDPERLETMSVTASFFRVLGARPLLGSLFAETDERPEAARVALLAESLWRRRFGGDPAIVGRSITLDGVPHLIVGVLGDRFR